MESHDAEFSERPTMKPEASIANPTKTWVDACAEIEAEDRRREDMEVRCYALVAAATLMSGPDANEEHVINLARRLEGYIRNG